MSLIYDDILGKEEIVQEIVVPGEEPEPIKEEIIPDKDNKEEK